MNPNIEQLLPQTPGLRRTVALVAIFNLAYFVIEFAVAAAIHSVSLFADSADFLEDASVNLLILKALAWTARRRGRIGTVLAGILLLPAAAMLWALSNKLHDPVAPAALPLGITGLGAMAVNLACAAMLARYRHQGGSLTKAAFLSARNDVIANIAIVAAGLVTAWHPSVWPDILIGVGVGAINANAAHEVWTAARTEHRLGAERA